MNFLKKIYLPLIIVFTTAVLPACKAKKPVVQPPPPVVENKPTPAPAVVAPAPEPAPAPAPVVEKPDYNFKNIKFEFNSGILKTDAYPILDKAAAEIKKDPSVRFVLNGNSSAEGSTEHNMALSIERANAVKTYLVNTGVNAGLLDVKGYGESMPVSPNTDEASRALNRRVEIKKL